MKAEVPRTDGTVWHDLGRRILGEATRCLIEAELPDLVRPSSRDVRDEGEAIGRVGLKAMRASGRFAPLDRRVRHRAIGTDRMHCDALALVVRREKKPSQAVG